ncbi:MAG TPA: hypothetical protein VNB06_08435 [Thermoanaerobaculia bacterium]|nr:hypothetical protein [Thermoanaerobaculia bacterium]
MEVLWLRARYRRTPKISLTGLHGELDELYDGPMLEATARWWNEFLERRPKLVRADCLRAIDPSALREIQGTVNPANRELLEERVRACTPAGGRLSEACFALGYAFARTLTGGLANQNEVYRQLAPVLRPDDLQANAARYDMFADEILFVEQSPGVWRKREAGGELVWQWTIAAARWAYADQVKRWEKAIGRPLGDGAGFHIAEGTFVSRFSDRLFEEGGRFHETEIRVAAGTLTYPLTSSDSSESSRRRPSTLSDAVPERTVARRLAKNYVEPLPEGAACSCCGSTDIDPSEGRVASYWFQCRECKISVRYIDLLADGERVGYRETICQRHGRVDED